MTFDRISPVKSTLSCYSQRSKLFIQSYKYLHIRMSTHDVYRWKLALVGTFWLAGGQLWQCLIWECWKLRKVRDTCRCFSQAPEAPNPKWVVSLTLNVSYKNKSNKYGEGQWREEAGCAPAEIPLWSTAQEVSCIHVVLEDRQLPGHHLQPKSTSVSPLLRQVVSAKTVSIYNGSILWYRTKRGRVPKSRKLEQEHIDYLKSD